MSAIRVGLYGGTFDPIHKGHMHVITQLFARDLIDELIVIPAGQPWMQKLLKKKKKLTKQIRLAATATIRPRL